MDAEMPPAWWKLREELKRGQTELRLKEVRELREELKRRQQRDSLVMSTGVPKTQTDDEGASWVTPLLQPLMAGASVCPGGVLEDDLNQIARTEGRKAVAEVAAHEQKMLAAEDADMETWKLEQAAARDRDQYYSPDYVPADIAHLDLALPPRPRVKPLPMAPDPHNEANRVYVVNHHKFGNLCVMTSPVDAAVIVKKLSNGARVESFVLNAA